ncbi:MAG: SRPBCC family protein [Opitutaceae bacterium]|nr:SRPBCC family protein [Opitutaceae bacterium]MBP9913091.1 SRPBCC family protein [Opitutaceae bacterium]
MPDQVFSRSVRIERPAAEVFAWHEQPGAFARLCPPWERVEVTSHVGGIRDGARVSLRVKVGFLWVRWEIVHRDYVAGRQFRDVLLSGPFARWEHLHRVESAGPLASVLTDEIHYRLPLEPLGRWFGGAFTRRKLERMFAHRHAVTKAAVEQEAAQAGHPASPPS